MDSDAPVTLGVWTNWSRGPVMGRTLTTTRENGNLLIAFTAFLIPFVATRFWKISALVFHQYSSTSNSRDAIHHQRQVILRNSGSAESGLWSFIELLWAWRTARRQRAWLRILPIALFAASSIATFTVAGGFSSSISSEAGEVLLKGDNCQAGTDRSSGNNATARNAVRSYWSLFTNNMANYAKNCYANQTSGIMECSRFVIGAVPTAVMDYNAPCPFHPDICRRNSGNIRFDTGHLSSDKIFGLNTRPGETFKLRYVLQVSALRPTPTSVVNTSVKYNIDPVILRGDGEVAIYFLQGNGVRFLSRTEDDWYRGTAPDGQGEYLPEEAASPLGCIDQFQWCRDPSQGQCGNLTNQYDALYSAAPFFNLTREELDPDRPIARTEAGSLLLWAYYMLFNAYSLSGLIDILGPASLASQITVVQGLVFNPKENQWHLDVTQWWNIMLSVFQAKFVVTAQGSGNSTSLSETIKPENDYERALCRSQKVRSTQYASFSVFGLALTYSVGALIVVVSFSIEPILKWLQKRGFYSMYKYLEWEGNTAIQLHRVAQDQLSNGTWEHCNKTIPTTQPGEPLGPFDIRNPKHPMLARVAIKPPKQSQDNDDQIAPQDQISQGSPPEHGGGGSSTLTNSSGVRRVLSDANAQPYEGIELIENDR
ncbi:cytochrome p450 protein, partial [Apiospora kogelbergensis]|uniref:cytochrome p450 protein n=1 Tax=Apiospora kogelbergensis TaxID=1337665 RepID=UPI00312DDD4F